MNIDEKEKSIEENISKLFDYDFLILKHSFLIDRLVNILYIELSKYDFDIEIDLKGKLKTYDINERYKFVKDFYKKHNIDFDIDKIFTDGTIELINIDTKKESFQYAEPNLSGSHRFVDEKSVININNTGYMFDSVTLAHEISHHRNQTIEVNEINDLFTETLALTEATIMGKEVLTNDEYQFYLIKKFRAYYMYCYNNHLHYDFIALYKEKGSINYENYCSLFGKISKKDYYDKLENIVKSYEKVDLFGCARYTIAGLFVPYLINKYEENNLFFDTIEKLHVIINSDDISNILMSIGLVNSDNNFLNQENINILLDNLNLFLSREMKKGVVK